MTFCNKNKETLTRSVSKTAGNTPQKLTKCQQNKVLTNKRTGKKADISSRNSNFALDNYQNATQREGLESVIIN
jgi:hypothetical protein